MTATNNTSRRNFLRAGGAFATVAGLSRFGLMNAFAQNAPDYKALVCVFLFGGNDSHNMLIPQSQAAFNAYKSIRGSLALPDANAKLIPVSAANARRTSAMRSSSASQLGAASSGKRSAPTSMASASTPTIPKAVSGRRTASRRRCS